MTKNFLMAPDFHGSHHFVRRAKTCSWAKPPTSLPVSISTGAQGLCHRDDWRKILFAVCIGFDMRAARVTGRARCKDPALYLLAAGRHDAIGREQDRPVERHKLVELLPPRVPVVPGQVVIFFEKWIVMGRQHLAVGIHIHACTFWSAPAVAPGLSDRAPISEWQGFFTYTDIYFRDLRMTIFCRVGLIQKRHRSNAELARF